MDEKKPRWEVKFEQYKQEGTKYEEMKKHLKALKEGKVKGNFKTKQEYQDFVDERAKQIAEYEKNIKEYDNFKKNEQKVQNILEYRNGLIEKLNKLPKVRNEEEAKKLNNKKEEQAGKAQRIGQYQIEIDDLKQQLKNDLSENDRQILLLTLKAKMDAMGILQEEQSKLDREIARLEEIGKDVNEEIQGKTATYERRIAKCNIIAANLLKGKDLGEFEIKVVQEDKKFKSNDGKLPIETEKARQENVQKEEKNEYTAKPEEEKYGVIEDEDKTIAEVSNFATKYPILAKIGNFFKNLRNRVTSLLKKEGKEEMVEEATEGTTQEDDKAQYFEEIEKNVKTKIDTERFKDADAITEDLEPDFDFESANVAGPTTAKSNTEKNLEDEENELLKQITEKGEKQVNDEIKKRDVEAHETRQNNLRKKLADNKLRAQTEQAAKDFRGKTAYQAYLDGKKKDEESIK